MNAVGWRLEQCGAVEIAPFEAEIVGTSKPQIQEKTNKAADSALVDHSAKVTHVDANAADKFNKIRGIISPVIDWRDAFLKKDWLRLSEAGTAFISAILPKSLDGKSSDDIRQAAANFIGKIDNGEIREAVGLAIDVLTHPEKNGDFEEINGASGLKFGKKRTLHAIKAALEQLSAMEGLEADSAKEILTAAKKVVRLKLNMARGVKAAGCVAKAVSITADVVASIGSCGTGSVPVAVKCIASSLDSTSAVGQMAMGKSSKREIQQTEGRFNTLQAKGIEPDAFVSIGRCNELAVDVLKHPEKNRDFEITGGVKFGKKDTKQFLHEVLDKFDGWTANVVDQDSQEELGKVKQDIQTAHDIVSSKLNKARAIKSLKISGAILGTTASIAACVATFGAAAPAIPAAISVGIGALGTAIRDIKLARELVENKH
jgi:hypothetical protein